jgi:hypothetical protein
MSMRYLSLTLPRDQRISELAMAIWRAGIRPDSWAMQCGPDFLRYAPTEDDIRLAVQKCIDKVNSDAALRDAVAEAEAIFNRQGKSLYVDERGNRIDTPNITTEEGR